MALRFAMSGGNFIFSSPAVSGIWFSAPTAISNAAPAGRGDSYAFTDTLGNGTYITPNLGGNYAGLVAGFAWFNNTINNNQILIAFRDASGNAQCDLRMNGSGQLFFTRNGTVIGGISTAALVANAWAYIEFKAVFSTSGTGTCEARINGVSIVSSSSLTNATTTAAAAVCAFVVNSSAGTNPFIRDFYVVDTGSGANTSYLGDINVVELFPNAAGVNSAWAASVGPFVVTNVSGSGSSWTFTGAWPSGAGNIYVGYNFNTSSCGSGNNQTGVECTASAAGSITLNFAGGSTQSGLTGAIAFQNMVQIGINQLGTRPNGDNAYIIDSTTNDISDFAHTALVLSGVILGVVHQTYARKDDLGSRQIAQVCLSAGTTEVGAFISLGNTYQYYQDILEVDPHTSAQFTVSGLNAATFGVKELT